MTSIGRNLREAEDKDFAGIYTNARAVADPLNDSDHSWRVEISLASTESQGCYHHVKPIPPLNLVSPS
jgi:hypothetical protein